MKERKDESISEFGWKEIGKDAKENLQNLLRGNKPALILLNAMEKDEGLQSTIAHANSVAVGRLNYNDHGVTHLRISSLNSLRILGLLYESGIVPNTVRENTGSYEDAQVVVLGGAYLHDLGNAVHRSQHHIHGMLLANDFLRETLPGIYNERKAVKVNASILECVYSHDEGVMCISVEAGCAKVGDGTDMACGRARVPFAKGKVDIHSVSAMAVESVEIKKGEEKPVRIEVGMNCSAGIFQIQEVLGAKINSSGLKQYIEVIGSVAARERESIFEKIEF